MNTNMNIIDYIYPLTSQQEGTVSSQTKGWESLTHAVDDLQAETLTIRFNAPTPVNHLSFTVKGCSHGTLTITGLTEDNMSIPLATNLTDGIETMITPTPTTYTYTITSTTPVLGLVFTFTPLKADAAYMWIVQNLMISSTLSDTHPLDYEGLQTVDSQQNINTLHVTSYTPAHSEKAYWISSLTDTSTRSQFLTLPLPSYPVSGITLNPLYEGQQINVYYNPNTVHQLTWDYSPHQNIYTLQNVSEVENGTIAGLVGAATFTLPPLSQLPLTLTMKVLLTSTYPTCVLQFDGTPYTLTVTNTKISVKNTLNNTQIIVLEYPQPLLLDAYNHLLTMSLTITETAIILTATASKLNNQGTVINTINCGSSSQPIPSATLILYQDTVLANTPLTLPETEEILYLQLTRPTPYHTLGTISNQTITNPLTLIGNDNNNIGYDSEDINPFNPAASSHLITTPTTITFTCPNNSLFYTLTTHIKGSLPTSSNTVFLITDTTTGDTLPLQCEAINTLETDDQYWTEYTTTIRFPEKYHDHPLTLTITPQEPLTISMLRLWNTTAPQQLIPLDTSNGTSFNPTVSIPLQLLTMSSTPQLTGFTTRLLQAESLTLRNGILNTLTLTTGNTPLLTYTSTQSLTKYTTCGLIPSPLTSWEPLVLNRTLNSQTVSFPYVCHGGTLLLEFTQLTPITLSMDMILHTLQNLDYQPPEKTENSRTAAVLSEEEKTYYQNPSDITNPLITISNNTIARNSNPTIPPHHIQQRSETVSSMTSVHTVPHVNENTDYQIVNGQTLDHTVLLPGHQQSVSPSALRMLMNNLTPYTNGKSNHQNKSMTLSKQFHLQQFTTRTRNHTAYHTGLLNFMWQPVNTLITDQLTLTGSMLTIQTPRTLSYMKKTLTHNHTEQNGIATITFTTLRPFRTLNFSNYSGTLGETILLPLHETPVLTQSYWEQHPSLNSVWNDQKVTWESPSIVWGASSPSLPTSMNFITQNITHAAGKALNCENIQSLQLPSVTITHPVEQINTILHLQLLTNTLTTPPLLTLTFTNNETVIETTTRINPYQLTPVDLQFPPISLSKGTWTIHLNSSIPLSFLLYQATIRTSSISILLNANPNSENGVWYNITSSIMGNTNYTLPAPVTVVELQFILNNGESFTTSTITPAYDTGYTTLPAVSTMNHILRISPQPPTSILLNQTLLLQPESLNLNTSMINTINPLACVWESTNPDVLTVNQYGFISGIQPGTAQVRVHWLDNIWESNLITVEE